MVVGLPALIVACMDQDAFAKCNQDRALAVCSASFCERVSTHYQAVADAELDVYRNLTRTAASGRVGREAADILLCPSAIICRRVLKRNDGPVRPGGRRFLNVMWMY